MTTKQECIQFHQWVVRLHYTGYPKVTLPEPRMVNGVLVYSRDMTIDELYDYYDKLSPTEKSTAFIS